MTKATLLINTKSGATSSHFTNVPHVATEDVRDSTSATTVAKLDAKANNYIRMWLTLPRCLSNAALFGRNALQLPLKSITLGYKLEKTRLILELRQSSDQLVRNTGAKIRTGGAWKADAVDNAIFRLKCQELIGRTPQGRSGLGWGEPQKF